MAGTLALSSTPARGGTPTEWSRDLALTITMVGGRAIVALGFIAVNFKGVSETAVVGSIVTVAKVLATRFAIAVVRLPSIYLGAGALRTWIGLVVFLAAPCWIIWLCDGAVAAQRERFWHERNDWAEARE